MKRFVHKHGRAFGAVASGATLITISTITYFQGAAKARANNNRTLNPREFTPFTLFHRDRVSDTSSLLSLRPNNQDGNTKASTQEIWRRGIWSIEIMQPQLMIARRYTPIPRLWSVPASGELPLTQHMSSSQEDIELLVRRSPQSEIPYYLHSVPLGFDQIQIRGPYMEFEIPLDVSEVLFIAGGTGIAPALQVVRCLQERVRAAGNQVDGRAADDHTIRMSVLWANRARGECIGATKVISNNGKRSWIGWVAGSSKEAIPETVEREGAQSPIVQYFHEKSACSKDEKQSAEACLGFDVRYFIDEERTFIGASEVTEALERFSSTDATATATNKRRLILVSGPDGFVNYIAGPKRLVNGVERQGSVGGILGRIDTTGWDVWKL